MRRWNLVTGIEDGSTRLLHAVVEEPGPGSATCDAKPYPRINCGLIRL